MPALQTRGSRFRETVSNIPDCFKLQSVVHLINTIILMEEKTMVYVCGACGWEYDEEQGCPEKGIEPGTKFEDLPDDFDCPLCGVGKEMFEAR